MMSPRERVVTALRHEETDHPPADLGSTCNTSITRIAYLRLAAHLGMRVREPAFLSRNLQVVEPDERILHRLSIDTRGIHARGIDAPSTEGGAEEAIADSATGDATAYRDEWGLEYGAARLDGAILYYEVTRCPLAGAESIRDIESFPWPDPDDPRRTVGLREEARKLREETSFALVGHMGDTSIFQACTALRGMQQFLVDLIANRPLAAALLQKVTEIQSWKMARFLEDTGEYLDVVGVGDDFAGQQGLLLSPELFREMILPYLKRYFRMIREKTPARLHLHSCGALRDILPDLVDIGVEVLNPVQVSARGMDPVELKCAFGKNLSFWGGIDTQHVLGRGTPSEVAQEVRRIAGILGRGGGYVLNPVHNIQPDVPPQNIVALFDAFPGGLR
jgi:uroporphyrinogen decarboxylase